MTIVVDPELGVPLEKSVPPVDLKDRMESVANTAKELGEHGSGYVVYFHFLRVMAVMMFFMSLVMLYPIIYFNNVDDIIVCDANSYSYLSDPSLFPDVNPAIVPGPDPVIFIANVLL